MSDLENRLVALEARLEAAEDELAIIRLIASYGPLVDCGSPDLAPTLFADDGVYDVSFGRMTGPAAISSLLTGPEHQSLVRSGIAHVMGLPWVRVDQDTAVATNCTQLYLKDENGYTIFRVAQNLWKLKRTGDSWKVVERINRLIGDDDEARALLESAV